MDIEQLLKRQGSLASDLLKGLKARGSDAAGMTRPLAVSKDRAAAIQNRISAIEETTRQQIAWSEQQISELKVELEALVKDIKASEKLIDPAVNATRTGSTKTTDVKPK